MFASHNEVSASYMHPWSVLLKLLCCLFAPLHTSIRARCMQMLPANGSKEMCLCLMLFMCYVHLVHLTHDLCLQPGTFVTMILSSDYTHDIA